MNKQFLEKNGQKMVILRKVNTPLVGVAPIEVTKTPNSIEIGLNQTELNATLAEFFAGLEEFNALETKVNTNTGKIATNEQNFVELDGYLKENEKRIDNLENRITYEAYSSTKTYSIGQYSFEDTTLYFSKINNNLGNTPSTSPNAWGVIGYQVDPVEFTLYEKQGVALSNYTQEEKDAFIAKYKLISSDVEEISFLEESDLQNYANKNTYNTFLENQTFNKKGIFVGGVSIGNTNYSLELDGSEFSFNRGSRYANVTGADGTLPGHYVTKRQLDTKQNTLTAGAGIAINNDTISVSGAIPSFTYPNETPVHVANWNGKKVYRYVFAEKTLVVDDNRMPNINNAAQILGNANIERKSSAGTWDAQGTTEDGSTGQLLALTKKIFVASWEGNKLIIKIEALNSYTLQFRGNFDYISTEDAE